MKYIGYLVETCPSAMLSKYPTPAVYAAGKLYVFGETLEDATGTKAPKIMDVAAMGFNEPFVDGADGIIASELDALIKNAIDTGDDSEIVLSKSQGNYLWINSAKGGDDV